MNFAEYITTCALAGLLNKFVFCNRDERKLSKVFFLRDALRSMAAVS